MQVMIIYRCFTGKKVTFWVPFGANLVLAHFYHISTYLSIPMKTSNRLKTNINFSYVMQSTNQLIDNDSLNPRNPMILRSHTSPTHQPIISESFKRQSSPSTPRNSKKKVAKDNEQGIINQILSFEQDAMDQRSQFFQQNALFREIKSQKVNEKFNTPRKNKKKEVTLPPTTISKDIKVEQQEYNKDQINKKGLALISSLILEVLESQYKEKKKFSCGEIAIKVQEEFIKRSAEDKPDLQMQEKDKRTIKRRVYDSINVLKALGKIKKDKKMHFMESIDRKIGLEIVSAKKEIISHMDQEYKKKQECLKRVMDQYEQLKLLKARNQELLKNQKKEIKGSAQSQKNHQEKYHFPVLLAFTEKNKPLTITKEVRQRLDDSEWQQIVTIEAEPLNILSELSCLSYLNAKDPICKSKSREKARSK